MLVIGTLPLRRMSGLCAMSIPWSFLFSFDFVFFDLCGRHGIRFENGTSTGHYPLSRCFTRHGRAKFTNNYYRTESQYVHCWCSRVCYVNTIEQFYRCFFARELDTLSFFVFVDLKLCRILAYLPHLPHLPHLTPIMKISLWNLATT